MTARKPKTAEQIAREYQSRNPCPDPSEAHLAGQRCGRARMRGEIGEVLNELLDKKAADVKRQPAGDWHYDEASGIRLAAAALNIKLKESNDG